MNSLQAQIDTLRRTIWVACVVQIVAGVILKLWLLPHPAHKADLHFLQSEQSARPVQGSETISALYKEEGRRITAQ